MSLQSVMPAMGSTTFSGWPESVPCKLKISYNLTTSLFFLISGKYINFVFCGFQVERKAALALLFPSYHLSLHITYQKRVQRFWGKMD